MSDLLWEPPAARKAASNMAAFMARAHAEKGAAAEDYAALHRCGWFPEQIGHASRASVTDRVTG